MRYFNIKLAVVGLAVIAVATTTAILATGGQAGAPTAYTPTPQSNFSTASAAAWTHYSVYNVGSVSSAGALTAVNHWSKPADAEATRPTDYIDYMYGTCSIPVTTVNGQPEVDGGCTSPLEIQVWPACIRNLGLYPGVATTTVRGVPAAYFEDRLELQTGNSTVVIFGASPQAEAAAAASLRGVNKLVQVTADLPAPTTGALTGTLACS
jgi:hypothetical protein